MRKGVNRVFLKVEQDTNGFGFWISLLSATLAPLDCAASVVPPVK